MLVRDFNNISKLVRIHREKKGISQIKLSEELKYKNGQFVSNIERGLCSIPLRKINLLSEVLNVDPTKIKLAIMNDFSGTLDKCMTTPADG